ncbi:helix-turn-helix domain-containing protein [Deinococcus fonticola]|nr:helix-turn-helix domain-containing protein [Deinococcus fonticola]
MTVPRKEWMRVSEVIKHFGLPRQRVYEAIKSGELPAADIGTTKRPSTAF